MKQKIIRYFSLLVIALSLMSIITIYFSRKIKFEANEKIINNLINIKTGFNYINNDIVGYLEVERVNIRNVIKKGVSQKVLDENVIGMLEQTEFGKDNNDIFLAGHNIKDVFGNLHIIKKGDIVKITTNDSCYRYIVDTILIVREEEIEYLTNNHLNRLTMMTCTNQPDKRLIIICRLI